ncbi:hypothetical protein HRR83_004019 [Exophiala dermatitidis]|uniref:MFS transporter, ACS family, allantoate permease n=2 Tax=Exophiala dermatitidis TaxID=5970 RepID=H6BRY1_EXODN|nr:MFS transporter, ACS family, allantoate permease [Exophiala dermatitidis NIH/UT8656]KAJ4507441.1 hypothetical protein HRR73_007662 [Exophiala dermatitidis]EHY54809.1 MFS transporter, ACS family, allantoate permease [Exophiala dermatitidis NIH/UT8656]KAJ4521680.1 hypothetical protein HRR74_003505 [Exophiala dermatitidis]KAJ4531746.1 hypothetical protein HRR77_009155 [Exophiala dermatitidis]KAJ4545102.1 hypothetical protein HRR76_003131 [Exophiala dermatitidis]
MMSNEKMCGGDTVMPIKPEDEVNTSSPLGKHESIEDGVVKAIDKDADAALQFLSQGTIHIDEETDKRIRRTIDWHIMPWMFGIYMLQYLDKTSLTYAAVMGIRPDLNINSVQYPWTGSIFYFGYLAFEYPHNRLMQRLPLMKYVSCTVIIWGIVLCCHAGTTNFATLMVARFFLGALEGSVTAGFVLYTARFYRSDEQITRTSFWFCGNGFASIIGGAIAYGIAKGFAENPALTFAPWKVIFIITGILTTMFGIGMLFYLPDSPINAKWLNDADRHLAVERLRSNQQGIGTKAFKWYQFREALTDVRAWLYALVACTTMLPAGGFTVFFTLLIQGYGFDSRTTLLLSMPAGFFQILSNVGLPWIGYKTKNRTLAACCGMLGCLFAISLMAGLATGGPTNHRVGQLVGYYMWLGNSATALIIILSCISTNVAGYTKKTTVNAMVLIAYCVGFLIGPQTFRDGPYYPDGKYTTIALNIFALGCLIFLYFLNRWENAKRDALQLPPQPEEQAFMDLTDRENKYFRYAL